MPVRNLADVTKIGQDVLSTTQSTQTGHITAQLGDVVSETPASDDAEWYFPPGMVARPRAPDKGQKACQVAVITRPDHDAIIGCRDERVQGIYGQLADGETAVFASAQGGGVAVFKKDGSIAVTSGDGSASVTVKTGGVVQVGDNTAQALAMGAALQAVITMLQGIAATWIALSPPSTPITAAALNGYGTTIQTALNAIAKIQTTKAQGT